MWDRPGSGIKLVSHALQGGFLATGSSGKPIIFFSIKLAQHSSLKLHVSSSGCIGLMWLSYLAVPRMLKMWKDPWTPCTAKMKEGLYASGNFPLIVVGPVCHELVPWGSAEITVWPFTLAQPESYRDRFIGSETFIQAEPLNQYTFSVTHTLGRGGGEV